MKVHILKPPCQIARLMLKIPLFLAVAALAPVLHAQTTGWSNGAAGTHDYNNASNWADSDGLAGPTPGDINGVWSSGLAVSGTQIITFGGNTPLGYGFSFAYTGNFGLTFRGAGATRTLTLGGDIIHNGGTSATINFGSSGMSEGLFVDLGGAERRLVVGSGRTLGFVNAISNGSLVISGGTVNFSGANSYTGTTRVTGGTLSLNGPAGSSALSDITVIGNPTSSNSTLVFNANSGTSVGTTRAKSVTLVGVNSNAGASLNVTGNSTVNNTETITNALAVSGYGVITLSPNAARHSQLVAGSFTRNAGAIALFRGANLGLNESSSQAAGSSNVSFTTGPVLLGGGGAKGTSTVSILAGVLGSTSASGSGFNTSGTTGGLVTYDAANGVRLLLDTEYKNQIDNGQTQLDNVRYSNSSGTQVITTLSAATTTINSLSLVVSGNTGNQGITITGDAATTLKINSGVIYADQNVTTGGSPAATDAMTISVPTLDFNGQEAIILVNTRLNTGGTVQSNAPLIINSAITNATGLTIGDGLASGPGGMVVLGGSTANTYTGVTTINGAIVRLNKTSVSNSTIIGKLVINSGSLYNQGNQIADDSTVEINGGTFFLNGSNNSGSASSETIGSLIMTAGGVSSGSGSGNTFTVLGNMTLSGGIVNMPSSSTLNVGINAGSLITLSGGTVTVGRSSSNTVSNGRAIFSAPLNIINTATGAYTPITLTAGTAADQNGAQLLLNGDLTFTGNSSNAETTTIAAPTGVGDQGQVALNAIRTFDIGDGAAAADLAIDAPMVDGTSAGGVNKLGLGTLLLRGESTYSGPTTVAAGRLLANNTTGSATGLGGVTVNAGATLGGTGRVTASAGNHVLINGILQMGDHTLAAPAPADFELGGDSITFGATSRTEFDLFGGSGDTGLNNTGVDADYLIVSSGSVSITGGAAFYVNASSTMTSWAAGDSWKLIDWATMSIPTGTWAFSSSVDSTLASMNLGWDTSKLYTEGTISIVNVVPEPSRAILLLAGIALVGLRRRR